MNVLRGQRGLAAQPGSWEAKAEPLCCSIRTQRDFDLNTDSLTLAQPKGTDCTA